MLTESHFYDSRYQISIQAMKIEGIFIGKSKEVSFNNRPVKTGIYKEVVAGPVRVTKLLIEGDHQADLTVHGGEDKAVYGYPVEHYDFWRKERPDLEFAPGMFGENLALLGLYESVCVGDQFKINDVVLQVTTPRMPCFKLGIRMNDNGFIKDFMQAERNGFYFRVIQEGTMQAGDRIEKVGEDGYKLSIAETIQLYTSRKDDKELLKKATASPSLPKDWVDHFEVQLHKLS